MHVIRIYNICYLPIDESGPLSALNMTPQYLTMTSLVGKLICTMFQFGVIIISPELLSHRLLSRLPHPGAVIWEIDGPKRTNSINSDSSALSSTRQCQISYGEWHYFVKVSIAETKPHKNHSAAHQCLTAVPLTVVYRRKEPLQSSTTGWIVVE